MRAATWSLHASTGVAGLALLMSGCGDSGSPTAAGSQTATATITSTAPQEPVLNSPEPRPTAGQTQRPCDAPVKTTLIPGCANYVFLAITTGEGWHYKVKVDLLPKPVFTSDITNAPPGRSDWNVTFPVVPKGNKNYDVDPGRNGPTLTVANDAWAYSRDIEPLVDILSPPQYCGFTPERFICSWQLGNGMGTPAQIGESEATRIEEQMPGFEPDYIIHWFVEGGIRSCGIVFSQGKLVEGVNGLKDSSVCGTATISDLYRPPIE